jgi:hypothetical protein
MLRRDRTTYLRVLLLPVLAAGRALRRLLARVADVGGLLDLADARVVARLLALARVLARLLLLVDVALALLVLAGRALVERRALLLGGLRVLGRVSLQQRSDVDGTERAVQPTIECDLDSRACSEEMVLPSSSVIAAELPWGWWRGVSLGRHS